eukprot:767248-Hanusia_phi.AAC.1
MNKLPARRVCRQRRCSIASVHGLLLLLLLPSVSALQRPQQCKSQGRTSEAVGEPLNLGFVVRSAIAGAFAGMRLPGLDATAYPTAADDVDKAEEESYLTPVRYMIYEGVRHRYKRAIAPR